MNCKNHKSILFFLLIGMLWSCNGAFTPSFNEGEVEGYAPIYATGEELNVKILQAKALESPGKIYTIGNYLLVNERMKGIHIINNEDPSKPVNTAFLQIMGNIDMAMKNGLLYADQMGSLLVIDLNDVNNINVVQQEEHVFNSEFAYPPVRGTYFECVDPAKGVVVGWEFKVLDSPKCYR